MPRISRDVPSKFLEKIFKEEELNHMKIRFNDKRMEELKLLLHDTIIKDGADRYGTLRLRSDDILRMRFGMDDGIVHSAEEVAGMLRIPPYSNSRIRQMEKLFLARLRKPSVKRLIRKLVKDAVQDERESAREKERANALCAIKEWRTSKGT
ncbi:MAG: hypothetical protein KGI06_05580 [Candidatus Micrarchaeota archaeon]|nr:hypothetical protein [Candidatus Micrarchaeota archaeon]